MKLFTLFYPGCLWFLLPVYLSFWHLFPALWLWWPVWVLSPATLQTWSPNELLVLPSLPQSLCLLWETHHLFPMAFLHVPGTSFNFYVGILQGKFDSTYLKVLLLVNPQTLLHENLGHLDKKGWACVGTAAHMHLWFSVHHPFPQSTSMSLPRTTAHRGCLLSGWLKPLIIHQTLAACFH